MPSACMAKSNADEVSLVVREVCTSSCLRPNACSSLSTALARTATTPLSRRLLPPITSRESHSRTKDWASWAAGYNGGMAGDRRTHASPRKPRTTTTALPPRCQRVSAHASQDWVSHNALAQNEGTGVPLAQPVAWEDAWAGRALTSLPSTSTVLPLAALPLLWVLRRRSLQLPGRLLRLCHWHRLPKLLKKQGSKAPRAETLGR